MSKICKIAFCAVNSLFMIIGFTMCIGAVFFLVRPALLKVVLDQIELNDEIESRIAQYSKPTSIAFLGLGTIILSISSCGCSGVSFNSHCSIKLYIGTITIIFFISMISLVLINLYRETIRKNAKEEFIDQIKNSYTGDISSSVVTALTDSMHFFFQCCGIESYEEFHETKKWTVNNTYPYNDNSGFMNLSYPLTCCAFSKKDENFKDIQKCAADADSDEDKRKPEENPDDKTSTSTNRNFPCITDLDVYYNKAVSLTYLALAIIMGICFIGFGTAFATMRNMKRVK